MWSLRHLPEELRAVGTLLALDHIWREVDQPLGPAGPGSPAQVRRLVVVDEAWLLMRSGEGARSLHQVAKAARKRNAGLTVITQDAADLLATDLGQAVAANAATHILMRQSPQANDTVGDVFRLTDGERRLLLTAAQGTGLLVSGHRKNPVPDDLLQRRARPGQQLTRSSSQLSGIATGTQGSGLMSISCRPLGSPSGSRRAAEVVV